MSDFATIRRLVPGSENRIKHFICCDKSWPQAWGQDNLYGVKTMGGYGIAYKQDRHGRD
jgi:hypothetical protein